MDSQSDLSCRVHSEKFVVVVPYQVGKILEILKKPKEIKIKSLKVRLLLELLLVPQTARGLVNCLAFLIPVLFYLSTWAK